MFRRMLFSLAALALCAVPVAAFAEELAVRPVVTAAAASSKVISAFPARLRMVDVTTGASAGYVLVYDATAAPSDGTVTPVLCYKVAATSTYAWTYYTPLKFNTGVVVAFSTGASCFAQTLSATAFIAAATGG